MTEIARMHCSEEMVILGIINIVLEIPKRQQQAKIVINSILPMVVMRVGPFPLDNELKDSVSSCWARVNE